MKREGPAGLVGLGMCPSQCEQCKLIFNTIYKMIFIFQKYKVPTLLFSSECPDSELVRILDTLFQFGFQTAYGTKCPKSKLVRLDRYIYIYIYIYI